MNEKVSLTIVFPSQDSIDRFVGWLLDGGGEDNYYAVCKLGDEPGVEFLTTKTKNMLEVHEEGEE